MDRAARTSGNARQDLCRERCDPVLARRQGDRRPDIGAGAHAGTVLCSAGVLVAPVAEASLPRVRPARGAPPARA